MLWIIPVLLVSVLLVFLFLQRRKIKLLEKRLYPDHATTIQGCFAYSDRLVVKGVGLYGDLTGLEWMFRTMVGSYRRQKQACEEGCCQH